MKKESIIQLGFVAGISLVAVGCLPAFVQPQGSGSASSASGTSGGGGGGSTPLAAFTATVYPLVVQHCSSCHASSTQPFFAVSSAQSGLSTIQSAGLVDLSDPANSILVQRLSIDQHNCWSTCSANGAAMQAAIQQWASMVVEVNTQTNTSTNTSTGTTTTNTGTSSSTNTNTGQTVALNGRMNTTEQLVPANLPGPGGNTFTTLSYSLSATGDTISPPIAGATISFKIQLNDASSYLIQNLSITSPESNVAVNSIYIAINGNILPNDSTFSLVNTTIAKSNSPVAVAPYAMIMLMDQGVGVDQLALSFGSIATASNASLCGNQMLALAKPVPLEHAPTLLPTNLFSMFMGMGPTGEVCAPAVGANSLDGAKLIPLSLKSAGPSG